jgi:hypothetical protein
MTNNNTSPEAAQRAVYDARAELAKAERDLVNANAHAEAMRLGEAERVNRSLDTMRDAVQFG